MYVIQQAQKNHVDCVSALLSFPSVRDVADSDGRTALMWAAQRGNYNVLKAMLEREGDVHACDKNGATGEWWIPSFLNTAKSEG